MGSDFVVCPPATGQHGDSEFRRRQIVRNACPRRRVMDASPPAAKTVGNLDDARKVLREVFFETRFEHVLQKPMVFTEHLDQIVGLRYMPGTYEMRLGTIGIMLVDPPHSSHQVQKDLRHRIVPLLHRQGVFGHAHAAPVIALKVGAMRQCIRRKQAQALGKQRGI